MRSSARDLPWSVGDIADRFDLATHVLRHWEDEGLLTPARDAAGRRRYGEADAYRVAVIVSSKAAGMTLDQVRSLLDSGAEDRHAILTAHLADLEARMAEMRRSQHLTEHALECRAHDISTCPHFRSHVADIVAGTTRGFPQRPVDDHRKSGRRTPGRA